MVADVVAAGGGVGWVVVVAVVVVAVLVELAEAGGVTDAVGVAETAPEPQAARVSASPATTLEVAARTVG